MTRAKERIVESYRFVLSGGRGAVEIDVFDGVYPPAEDTFLIMDNLPEEFRGTFLEIGAGTGLIGITAAVSGADVLMTDVDPTAVSNTAHNAAKNGVEVEVRQGSLFETVRKHYDVIAFNPPYLPSIREADASLEDWERRALVSGRDGLDLTVQFLEQCADYLNKGGKAYLLASSVGDTEKLEENVPGALSFQKGHRDLGNERIFLYVLEKLSDRGARES